VCVSGSVRWVVANWLLLCVIGFRVQSICVIVRVFCVFDSVVQVVIYSLRLEARVC